MGKKKHKQPKKEFDILLGEKQVRESPQTDPQRYLSYYPSWQLGRIDPDGKWGWKSIGKDRWEKKILPCLQNFETMTWAEIEKASGGRKAGNNNHFIKTNEIIKEAQKRLVDLQLDDLDNLFSLRLEGKIRIYGIRNNHIMEILWFDFEHEICQSQKRNT